jgi:hypothetical protein
MVLNERKGDDGLNDQEEGEHRVNSRGVAAI